ncbi:hypothetical protein H4582DRAFT_2057512 [Lactarius indigo]|nr:hypothetical protein H4582DRAFT_2057512 [Lactarius indigo]
MIPSGPPTEKEILTIAKRTTDIIENHITSNVCLFGSAASYLWADIGRIPKDVDIVLWDEYEHLDPEDVKQWIIEADDRYYLEPSKRPGATYEILYCRLPGWMTDPDKRRVKVDILVPPGGDLGLPESYEHVPIRGIPVMPLFELLVMKTQGWWDHHTSYRNDFRAKVPADVTDIDALLDCAMEEEVSYQDESESFRHSDEFMDYALFLARMFANKHGRRWKWRRLGFAL